MRKAIYLIILLLSVTSCHDTDYAKHLLRDVDSLLESQPDSALRLILTVNPQRLHTRAMRARHSLLHTKALDKCFINITDDSILAPAYDYYSHRGNTNDRAHTYYYKGRIAENTGKTAESIQMLLEAEKYAEKSGDTYLLALIYNCRARFFHEQYSFDEAINLYNKADSCFTVVGKIKAATRMSVVTARLYVITRKYALARPKLQRAYAIFDSLNDKSGVMSIANLHANQMRHEGIIPLDSIKLFLRHTYNKYNNGVIPIDEYPIWTLFYLKEGKIDSARLFADMTARITFKGERKVGFLRLQSQIEEAGGDYKAALKLQVDAYTFLDSISNVNKANLIQRIEQGYKNKELLQANEILKLRTRNTISIALAVIILSIFIVMDILRRRRRMIRIKAEEIAQYKDFIERLNDDYQNLQSRHNQFAEEIKNGSTEDNAMLQVLERRLVGLQQLLDAAYSGACKPQAFFQQFKVYASSMNNDEAAFSDLQYVVNKRHHGIIDHLRNTHPTLTSSELNMLCMMLFGFSLDCMRLIYNHDNVDSIYSRRTKIREKLNLPPRFGLDKFLQEEIEKLRPRDGQNKPASD